MQVTNFRLYFANKGGTREIWGVQILPILNLQIIVVVMWRMAYNSLWPEGDQLEDPSASLTEIWCALEQRQGSKEWSDRKRSKAVIPHILVGIRFKA